MLMGKGCAAFCSTISSPSLCILSLWGVITQFAVLPTVSCLSILSGWAFFPSFPQIHSLFVLLFLFKHFPSFLYLSLSVSPHALRSTTQQPLNYSQQTTLCIFCTVPLHPSRIFPASHGCLSMCVHVCVCVCAPVHALVFVFSSPLPLMKEAPAHSSPLFYFIDNNIVTQAHRRYTQMYPQSKSLSLCSD